MMWLMWENSPCCCKPELHLKPFRLQTDGLWRKLGFVVCSHTDISGVDRPSLVTYVCLSLSVHLESLRSYITMGGTR